MKRRGEKRQNKNRKEPWYQVWTGYGKHARFRYASNEERSCKIFIRSLTGMDLWTARTIDSKGWKKELVLADHLPGGKETDAEWPMYQLWIGYGKQAKFCDAGPNKEELEEQKKKILGIEAIVAHIIELKHRRQA